MCSIQLTLHNHQRWNIPLGYPAALNYSTNRYCISAHCAYLVWPLHIIASIWQCITRYYNHHQGICNEVLCRRGWRSNKLKNSQPGQDVVEQVQYPKPYIQEKKTQRRPQHMLCACCVTRTTTSTAFQSATSRETGEHPYQHNQVMYSEVLAMLSIITLCLHPNKRAPLFCTMMPWPNCRLDWRHWRTITHIWGSILQGLKK